MIGGPRPRASADRSSVSVRPFAEIPGNFKIRRRQERWLFDPDRIAKAREQWDELKLKFGIDQTDEREALERKKASKLINTIGQSLNLPPLVINSATVFMHRFYIFHLIDFCPFETIAAVAIHLASKAEDKPVLGKQIVSSLMLALRRPKPSPFEMKQYLKEITMMENVLCKTLGFDFEVIHPHTYIIDAFKMFNINSEETKELRLACCQIAKSQMQFTQFCIKYPPKLIAAFCIYVGCKWAKCQIPLSKTGHPFYFYIDENISLDMLEFMKLEFCRSLDCTPPEYQIEFEGFFSIISNEGASTTMTPLDVPEKIIAIETKYQPTLQSQNIKDVRESNQDSASLQNKNDDNVSLQDKNDKVSLQNKNDNASLQNKNDNASLQNKNVISAPLQSQNIKDVQESNQDSASLQDKNDKASLHNKNDKASLQNNNDNASLQNKNVIAAPFQGKNDNVLLQNKNDNASLQNDIASLQNNSDNGMLQNEDFCNNDSKKLVKVENLRTQHILCEDKGRESGESKTRELDQSLEFPKINKKLDSSSNKHANSWPAKKVETDTELLREILQDVSQHKSVLFFESDMKTNAPAKQPIKKLKKSHTESVPIYEPPTKFIRSTVPSKIKIAKITPNDGKKLVEKPDDIDGAYMSTRKIKQRIAHKQTAINTPNVLTQIPNLIKMPDVSWYAGHDEKLKNRKRKCSIKNDKHMKKARRSVSNDLDECMEIPDTKAYDQPRVAPIKLKLSQDMFIIVKPDEDNLRIQIPLEKINKRP